MGNTLAVGPGEVGGAAHSPQVTLAFRRVDRYRSELPIGQDNLILFGRCFDYLQVVGTYLMSKAPGATVHHNRHLAQLIYPQDMGHERIENLVHHLHFQKVIAGP